MNAPLHESERMRTQGREMLRAMMQAHFDRRSGQERTVDVRGADGVERATTHRGSRTVMTEFGEVELERNLYAFHAPGSDDAEQWVDARLLPLLNGRSGGAMAKSLRAMVKSHNLDAEVAQPVERAAQYLVNNTCLLHYDRALAEGLPIATGVIEGACRYLVKDRMGRTGACWSLTGAEAILRLRALRASGDFDDYWLFHPRAGARAHPSGALRRPRRSQPAGITPAEAEARQVIETAPVGRRHKRAAPIDNCR
jgi:hypothetical protein